MHSFSGSKKMDNNNVSDFYYVFTFETLGLINET